MFNSLAGEITWKGEEKVFLLTGGGIEWELSVSRKTIEKLPPVGEGARLFTHLLHREDAMRLYGFSDPAERALFLDLQKVEGVGPRGAMKILSGIDLKTFVAALDQDDVESLTHVPGIGKKTAQKIILSLKGKLTPASETPGRSAEDDIASALMGMGFDRKTAKSSASAALKALAGRNLEGDELARELFKRAIAIAGGAEPSA
jgi:Holliday junction DNA helicase RuvA